MPQFLRDGQTSFAGGLNTSADAYSVRPDQVRLATEARLTVYGAISKRGGTQRTTAAPIAAAGMLALTGWYQTGGTTSTVGVINGSVTRASLTGAAPETWTTTAGTLSTSVRGQFAEFIDGTGAEVLYYADGGPLNRWTGTTLTENIASTPSCTALAVHNARLWGVGDASFPSSVFYSALNNGDSLGISGSSGGQINVRTFGAEALVALCSIGTSLLLFHERGVSRITGYGTDDIIVAPQAVSSTVAVCGPHAIAVSESVCFALTLDGLMIVSDTGAQVVQTPDKPDPTVAVVRGLTRAQRQNCRLLAVPMTRELWAYIPDVGVYVWHQDLQAWAGPWTGWATTDCLSWALTRTATGVPLVVRADTNGYVLYTDTATVKDDILSDGTGGSTIVLQVQTRRLTFGDPAIVKALRYVWALSRLRGTSTAQVQWESGGESGAVDLQSTMATASWDTVGAVWDTPGMTWDAEGDGIQRQPAWGAGRTVQATVVDDGTGQNEVNQLFFEAIPLGARG